MFLVRQAGGVPVAPISANLSRFPYLDLDLDVDLDVSVSDHAQRGARLPETAAAVGKKQTVAW